MHSPPNELTARPQEAASAAAEELARQHALSLAVMYAAESLLRGVDWRHELPAVLRRIGEASGVSRVYVFENHEDDQGRLVTSQRFEWAEPGVESQLESPALQGLALDDPDFAEGVALLACGEIIQADATELPPSGRAFLAAQDVRSFAVVPIFCEERWWGFIGFDDCRRERNWSESMLAVLGTAADLVGAAVSREEAEDGRRRLQRETADRRAALRASERAAFLAEATSILTSSFDYHTTLSRFARMAVPFLGDYCIVDVVDDGTFRRVATAHADPTKAQLVRGLEAFPPKWETNPIVRTFRAGTARIAGPEELTPDAITDEPEHRALVEGLMPRHGMFAPIRSNDGVIGVMTFCSCADERGYGAEELGFAEDIALRAGIAIGNAQIFRAAQHATAARDEVLAVVAHDLRNPLGTIVGSAGMLEEMVEDEALRKFTSIISRSADRMNQLIEDLLDATRLQRGTLRIKASPVRLDAIVAEADAMLQPLAQGRGIRLEAERAADGVQVMADTARILQVLSNLIGNAIKFTPEGGRVRLRTSLDGDHALIRVEDTGPGIPPDQVPHLFDRFWQARSGDRRGVGLGLSIARGIVEAHQGRVWAESELGRGSTFSFVLPTVAPEPPVAPAEPMLVSP